MGILLSSSLKIKALSVQHLKQAALVALEEHPQA